MECVQQVMCGGPAEPEDPVCAEEALPKGGGGAAFSLPREHTHSGSSLQHPHLPSRLEPWALVPGNQEGLGGSSPWKKEGGKIGGGVLFPKRCSAVYAFMETTLSSCDGTS